MYLCLSSLISAKSGAYHDFGERLVNVSYTGRVLFVASVQLHYSCVVDLTYWPHDTHNCTLVMGSWHHSGASIDLQIIDDQPRVCGDAGSDDCVVVLGGDVIGCVDW